MTLEHLEVLVEEPSMEAALRALLPRLLGQTTFEVYAFQCKDELLARLAERYRGYVRWLPQTTRILVVIDRDNDNCVTLKARLETIAAKAGLSTRKTAGNGSPQVVHRIAIEELESWFFGDWDAVRKAYPKVPKTIPNQAKYRDPDGITGGTWEALERVLKQAGYFKGGLRKIEAARMIAAHMDWMRNTSRSFCVLRKAIEEMIAS